MTGHLIAPEKVPAGLSKRWEEFSKEVRACWTQAHREVGPDAPATKLFEAYWNCMRKRAYHAISYEEAKHLGIKPHPICVLHYEAQGLPTAEAEDRCLKEGKYHGISLLAAELRKTL